MLVKRYFDYIEPIKMVRIYTFVRPSEIWYFTSTEIWLNDEWANILHAFLQSEISADL